MRMLIDDWILFLKLCYATNFNFLNYMYLFIKIYIFVFLKNIEIFACHLMQGCSSYF